MNTRENWNRTGALREQKIHDRQEQEKAEVQNALTRSKRFIRIVVNLLMIPAFLYMGWAIFRYETFENPFVNNQDFIQSVKSELRQGIKRFDAPSTIEYVTSNLGDENVLKWLLKVDLLSYDNDIEIENYLELRSSYESAMNTSVKIFLVTVFLNAIVYCLLMLGISLTQYHADVVRRAIIQAAEMQKNKDM